MLYVVVFGVAAAAAAVAGNSSASLAELECTSHKIDQREWNNVSR